MRNIQFGICHFYPAFIFSARRLCGNCGGPFLPGGHNSFGRHFRHRFIIGSPGHFFLRVLYLQSLCVPNGKLRPAWADFKFCRFSISWRQEYPAVDYQSCVKCGTCQRYCPADVVTIITNQEECVTFAWDFCKGCGICANECPKKCIEMIPAGGEK